METKWIYGVDQMPAWNLRVQPQFEILGLTSHLYHRSSFYVMQGWLGMTPLLPCRYFVHSLASKTSYALRIRGREPQERPGTTDALGVLFHAVQTRIWQSQAKADMCLGPSTTRRAGLFRRGS